MSKITPMRFCWSCEKGAVGRSYNIGGENERSNLELVRMLCAILDDKRPKGAGRYADQITFVPDRPGHDARYAIDPTASAWNWAGGHP
jgi:dTDP-glucose 4,6-dehydratase